ncbi:MAG: hypothetical protein AB1656_24100 [Candidatus Omnitrophota bacterium]
MFQQFREFLRELELKRIWISRIHADLFDETPKKNECINIHLNSTAEYKNLDGNRAKASTSYRLCAEDNNKNAILNIEFVIDSEYDSKTPFTDELFALFTQNVLPSQVYPYAREFIQNAAARMGFSPLTMPLWKAPPIASTAKKKAAMKKSDPKKSAAKIKTRSSKT